VDVVTLTLAGVGYAAALALAAVFFVAGVAKLAWRPITVDTFRQLGLPRPEIVAVVVPLVEVALAVALVAFPFVGGVASLCTLAAFNALLYRRVRQGSEAPCGCIGRPTDRAPVSARELARNGGLAMLAVGAIVAEPTLPSAAEIAVVAVAVALGWAALRRFARLPDAGPQQANASVGEA
jgi:hypothetical protein